MKPLVLAAAATAAPAANPLALPKTVTPPIAQALTVPPAIVPHTAIAANAPWLTHGIAGLFVISALALIVLLAVQTTKQEGLSGTIGGRVQSDFRGRLGADEQLKRVTGVTAIAFVVTAFVLSLTGI
ncbi:MAG: preprotein translocase subunit SecG [Vulcanimicrobiaceae bacterium]